MKLVFLDVKTIGEDIDLSMFEEIGEVVRYSYSTEEEIPERVKDADVIIVNKVLINERTIYSAEKLKLVCVTATGTNILDKDYLEQRGITWRNVAGYSTESVAQHTFAMLFYLLENMSYYDEYVRDGHYINDTSFRHFERNFHELHSKTWGIIGLGSIGRRVAEIARAVGADIIYYSASGAAAQKGYRQVDFDTLLTRSDIISVHAPINRFTEGLMDENAFRKMKKDAIFLNLGRGKIVDEKALVKALQEGRIKAAGLDVISGEPMSDHSALLGELKNDRLLITPHIGWASVEARTRLMKIIAGQIRDFYDI